MTGDTFGRTPLHVGAMKNDIDAMREALDAGASPDEVERRFGWTPLHFAAEYGSVEAAKLLLDAKAQVDAQGKDGQTSLWRAVMKRKSAPDGSMVKLLVSAGADADLSDRNGRSPRHLAEGMFEFPLEWLDA